MKSKRKAARTTGKADGGGASYSRRISIRWKALDGRKAETSGVLLVTESRALLFEAMGALLADLARQSSRIACVTVGAVRVVTAGVRPCK